MATDNKTVAEIVKQVRRECNSLPLPNAAGEKLKLVREINDAHRREMDGLRALVRYLADALESSIGLVNHDSCLDCKFCSECNARGYPHSCLAQDRFINLVKKARDAEIEKLNSKANGGEDDRRH